MLRKKRGQISSIVPGITRKKGGYPWKRAIGACSMLVASLFLVLVAVRSSCAHIPEPGIIIYGKVYDNGTQLTSGELTWTFTPAVGNSFVVTTQLQQIEAEGGPYSYRLEVPLVSAVPGSPDRGDAIVLSGSPVEYTRSAEVTGTSLSMQDTVTIGLESRGTFENINIGTPPANDTDEDGMPDDWEQAIVDADPNDGINGVGDVAWGDDFDGDGESNWNEFINSSDPTDASSTYNPDDAYTSYHFEIYQGAEQPESGDLEDSFWGAKLICWPRDGETFELGAMIKPDSTVGSTPIPLEVSQAGDEARLEEKDYDSLSTLITDYAPGTYVVALTVNKGGPEFSPLWFKITVPEYTETSFPGYLTINSPQPDETGVSTTPLLQFSANTWDYLSVLKTENDEEVYFHFNDQENPADEHQIPEASALEQGTTYRLVLDTNDWGNSWLGSITTLRFTTVLECLADLDLPPDGDVDGYDLSLFVEAYLASSADADLNGDGFVNADDIAIFANDFGKTGCAAP